MISEYYKKGCWNVIHQSRIYKDLQPVSLKKIIMHKLNYKIYAVSGATFNIDCEQDHKTYL